VRPGAGAGGSDRVTIIWPDGAIRRQWLQVTVRDTPAIGLSAPDVFYFGNAVGEAGNSPTNALVSAGDEIEARNDSHNLLNPATITNRRDYNRDSFVNAQDQIIARNNGTTIQTALRLIGVPAPAAAANTSIPPAAAPAALPAANFSAGPVSSVAPAGTTASKRLTVPRRPSDSASAQVFANLGSLVRSAQKVSHASYRILASQAADGPALNSELIDLLAASRQR
jgi:hypothetical protein